MKEIDEPSVLFLFFNWIHYMTLSLLTLQIYSDTKSKADEWIAYILYNEMCQYLKDPIHLVSWYF